MLHPSASQRTHHTLYHLTSSHQHNTNTTIIPYITTHHHNTPDPELVMQIFLVNTSKINYWQSLLEIQRLLVLNL